MARSRRRLVQPRRLRRLGQRERLGASANDARVARKKQVSVAWCDKLLAARLLHGADKLRDEPGKIVRRKRGELHVTDGPYSETKELLGGYFIIEADSYEQAIERSRDCPHLEYDGTIEIREVEVRP